MKAILSQTTTIVFCVSLEVKKKGGTINLEHKVGQKIYDGLLGKETNWFKVIIKTIPCEAPYQGKEKNEIKDKEQESFQVVKEWYRDCSPSGECTNAYERLPNIIADVQNKTFCLLHKVSEFNRSLTVLSLKVSL